jgi:hypothetical protein
MKKKFFCVSHGIDNYEEVINLDEVIFIRVAWKLPNGKADSDWIGHTEISFKNGTKEKVELSKNGFEELSKRLNQSV